MLCGEDNEVTHLTNKILNLAAINYVRLEGNCDFYRIKTNVRFKIKYNSHNQDYNISTLQILCRGGGGYGILCHFQQYFSYIVRRVAPYTPTRSCVHIGVLRKK